jgi:hypothetical protein
MEAQSISPFFERYSQLVKELIEKPEGIFWDNLDLFILEKLYKIKFGIYTFANEEQRFFDFKNEVLEEISNQSHYLLFKIKTNENSILQNEIEVLHDDGTVNKQYLIPINNDSIYEAVFINLQSKEGCQLSSP